MNSEPIDPTSTSSLQSRGRRQFRSRGRGFGRQLRPTNYINNNNATDNDPLLFNAENVRQFRGRAPRRQRGRGGNSYLRPRTNFNQNSETDEKHELKPEANRSAESPSVTNVQSEIAELQLKTNDFECMICCDNITRYQPIWYCTNCYNIFHLRCAIEWCNKSIKSRNEAIANAQYPSLGLQAGSGGESAATSSYNDDTRHQEANSIYRDERMKSVEWPCPTCREILNSRPGQYKCFCGKVVRPEVNRHLTPHSCGQLCGKRRPNIDCPHNCNTICHPGRCAPCSLASRRPCHCGKEIRNIKCSLGTYSCDEICSKPLACGAHFCTKTCHDGSCIDCKEILVLTCHCGEKKLEKPCLELHSAGGKKAANSMSFSCNKLCGKKLDCGKHYCGDKCHPGHCDSCKFLSQNIKTCPCGSTQIKKSLLAERKSCTDPMPTCESKCNRSLVCGPEKNHHRCQKKCHIGSCPPCKLKTTVHCECKLSTRTIDCSLMYQMMETSEENQQAQFKQIDYTFSCEARCNKLKNCGRHRCNNKCCKFIKTGNSSIHKCDQICNKKLPCNMHSCPEPCHQGQCGDCTNIGWEELTCHCGLSVLYPPIPCGARPPACHRICRRAHNCGHPVKHECHDDTETCAPCTVFVRKSCFCGADSKESVYCYQTGYSCGRTCKKLLACGQHHCQRVCHDNDCETPNEDSVILCKQPCPVVRFGCKHPCSIPCHGKSPCPSIECKKLLTITCECGNKTDRLECHKVMRDVDNRNRLAMLSTNRANQDSIMVDLSKTQTKSKDNSAKSDDSHLKQLECDETCSILKRNKALAEALDIAQPDLKPTSIFGEDPLRLLKEATAQDYKFVSATYNSLAKFIKTAKESEKRFIFMKFPPAGKLRREVVHELAHHFNCTSESSNDDEPFRHVIVRAYKNKSTIPEFTIEQLLPVSD